VKVIGTVGRNASGKNALVQYLHRRCGIPVVEAGDIARDMARKKGIEPTRENLHRISQQAIEEHGRDFFMERLIERIEESDWDVVGIAGIRTPADIRTLRERFGEDLLLVHVEVGDPSLRFRRTQARDDPRDPDTYQQFLQQDREEEEMFHLGEAIELADLTVENDGTLEEFHDRIEERIIKPELAERCQNGA